ncbi:MAG: hypothetical protein IKM36_04290 [Oscillospiraceae bacterium]|nr:hypothetical protein [Oscillospiraceae bacterium]MBR2977978.1 hypothetical protein [Oscillospiraceae bacterium]MBR3849695.1 hypothetical protein [Oscillospiraceae bacterium]
MAWAIERGLIDRQDMGTFWGAVNAVSRGEYRQTIDGLYIIERGSTVMLTDADPDQPSLDYVVKLSGTAAQINYMKGLIESAEVDGFGIHYAVRIAGLAFREQRAYATLFVDPLADGGSAVGRSERGEGSSRGQDFGAVESDASGGTGKASAQAQDNGISAQDATSSDDGEAFFRDHSAPCGNWSPSA